MRGWTFARAWIGAFAVLSLVLQLTLGAAHVHASGHAHESHGNSHPFHTADLPCSDAHDEAPASTHEDAGGKTDAAENCSLCLGLLHIAAFMPPAAIPLGAPARMAPSQIHSFQAAILARKGPSAHGTRAPPAA